MWSVSYHSQCPQCVYEIAVDLREQASFCPQCRFPLMVLAGKYRLYRLLGEGGAGKVYLAHHIGLDEASERVVKILNDKTMTQAQIKRFHREVQLTARVSVHNEHIVRIYDDFGYEENLGYYYVMEYLEGQLLSQALRERGPLSVELALAWFGQLSDAMRAAHRAGIIHRDLKPENIVLIARPPQETFLKVIDFGIAKRTEHGHEITENPMGTPFYMSPEQCLGQPLDPRSDIYAMGLILYEMLTGHDPFGIHSIQSEDELLTVVYAQIHETPRSICAQYPDYPIPAQLDEAILRALHKNPSQRYASVEAFWHQLLTAIGADTTDAEHTLGNWRIPTILVDPNASLTSSHTSPATTAITESPANAAAGAVDLATEVAMPSFEFLPSLATTAQHTGTLPVLESWSDMTVVPVNPGNISALHLPANRFIGRSSDWSTIDWIWQEGGRLLTILGPAGVGKTRLAQQYGYTQREHQRWTGGVWYCDLSECASVWDMLGTLAYTLQVDVATRSTLQGAVTAMGQIISSHGPSLWILDHFEHLVRLAHDTLGNWLSLAPEALFLVTSRQRLHLPEESLIELPPLNHEESTDLLVDRAAVWVHAEQLTAQPEYLAAVAQQLDGLPLAIELAASRLQVMSLPDLYQRLTHQFALLQESSQEITHLTTLQETIAWSWQMLSADEQSALAQCTVFRGGFTLDAGEYIVQLPEWPAGPSVTHVISSLRDQSMLRLHPSSSSGQELRFDMYEMIRSYATQQPGQTEAIAAAERRHAAYYIQWGQQQHSLLDNVENPEGSLCLESENLRAIYQRWLSRETELALQAHLLLYPIATLQGGTEQYLQDLHQALSVQGILSSQVRMQALQIQAECLRRLGQVDKARSILENALTMAYNRNNVASKAQLLNRLGNFYRLQGYLEQAETMHREALVLHRQQEDLQGVGVALGQLGNLYRLQGRMAEAERLHREALQLHRQQGDLRGESIALSQLGNLYRNQGKLDDAIDFYQQALALQSQQGDLRGESITLGNLGRIEFKQGAIQQAERYTQQALEIHRTLEDRRGESIALNSLGLMRQCMGHYAEAATLHTQALGLNRQLQDRRGEGFCLHHIARICRLQGEWQQAYQHLQQAITLHHTISDPGGVGLGMYQLGLLVFDQQLYDKAQSYLQQALGHLRHHQMHEEEGELLLALSIVHHARNDLSTALSYAQEALSLAAQWGDPILELHSMSCLLAMAADQEKFEKAHGAQNSLRQRLTQNTNPTLTLVGDLGSAHLDWALSLQAQFQQQLDIGQQCQEAALSKWNQATSLLQHAFPIPLTSTPPQPNPHIAATDLLRLHLLRLKHTMFG